MPHRPNPSFLGDLKDSYFTFDRRTLGFTRILLGFYLVTDLFRRTRTWTDMFSTEGVLPNHVNLLRPQAPGAFTLLNAFSTPGELWVLWAVFLCTYLCLMIGYRTKLMQILALVFVTSTNGRVLLIENGGYVVQNLLMLWTCFLPMGDRFSVDALMRSFRRARETTAKELNDRSTLLDEHALSPHTSILGLVLILQLSAIYFFNVVHKTGPSWRNFTAVHYVLYVDRMVTPVVALVRDHVPAWLKMALTGLTLGSEALIPFALLSPFRAWSRRVAIVLINMLHIGFGTAMILGPFAWACCIFSTLFFGREDWELAARTMRRERRHRTVLFHQSSGTSLALCRLLKRCDRFELLTFEADTSEQHIRVRTPQGINLAGANALADIIAALPLGPTVAWTFRLPGIRHIITRLMRSDLDQDLGLQVGRSTFDLASPSPLARTLAVGRSGIREVLIVIMFAGAVNQAGIELWRIRERFPMAQSETMRLLSQKLRFLQGWFMFSPNPVMDDGTIVVDAVTVDGRHIDPFTGKPPNFDLGNVKSFRYNQIWCDYFNRMHLPGNSGYRDSMKEYLLRYPKRTGRLEDTIVSGDVYWIEDQNPRWGRVRSYDFKQDKLFSFENPETRAQMNGDG